MDYQGRSYDGTPIDQHLTNGLLDGLIVLSETELRAVNVDPWGDTVLDTGDMCIRVSSYLMSQASPVFRCLLRGSFIEGTSQGSPQSPQVIVIREDVPSEYVIEFCKFIHHTFDDSKDFTQEEALIVGLADLCDKYQCHRIAKYWVACWFSHNDRLSAEASPGLLWATHVFRLEEEFTRVSSRWAASMNNLEIEFPTTRWKNIPRAMPQRIMDDLRGLRQKFIDDIRKMIEGYWIQLEIEPEISELPRVWCEKCGEWRRRYNTSAGYVDCPRCMTPLSHLATCHRGLRHWNLTAWLEARRLWPSEVLEVQSADWIVEMAATDLWITDGLHDSAEQDGCLYPRIISEIPTAFRDQLRRHELMGLKLGDYTWRV